MLTGNSVVKSQSTSVCGVLWPRVLSEERSLTKLYQLFHLKQNSGVILQFVGALPIHSTQCTPA